MNYSSPMNVEYLKAQLELSELQNSMLCTIITASGASDLEICVETMETELNKVSRFQYNIYLQRVEN